MTNEQIIAEIAMQIYGEEPVMEMIANGIDIPLHTFQGWTARGYKVKKGSHAIADTKLWKKKKRNQSEDTAGEEEEQQDGSIAVNRDFYLCKAFLFGGDQVEKAEAENG